MNGERLRDVFNAGVLQDSFAVLSERLGFHLSVFSAEGEQIFYSRGTTPLCQQLRDSSAAFMDHCDGYCRPFLLNVLSTGKPEVFRCYSKIVSFALPIEYCREKAVILGRGSFDSRQDERESKLIACNAGLDAAVSYELPNYTTLDRAWAVCGFVAESIGKLLDSGRETSSLKTEFESMKRAISAWNSSARERSETLYRGLVRDLSSLIHNSGIAVFLSDNENGGFTGRFGHMGNNGQLNGISLNADGEIVQTLRAGKSFAFSHYPAIPPETDRRERRDNLYAFPIVVNARLEGILCVAALDLAESEIQIITAFCRNTALSLENQQLHHDLYRKFERFTAISEVTRTITHIQDFNTLLRTILDESANLLKAEQGSLMLVDRESDQLLLSAKKGIIDGVTDNIRLLRGEGIAGRVAEFGEAILVEDVENDPRTRQKNRSHYKTRSFVSVPIRIENRIIGVLNLSDKATGEAFDEEDLKLIQSFATHAAIVMDRNMFQSKTGELEKLSVTDPLTGLLNRRYLHERLKRELARAERHGHSLSLLMIDIDGFKQCNDRFGHPFGDTVLRNVADILANTVRSMDIVARYGGDEFMVILPETGEAVAIEIAGRLLQSMKKTIKVSDGKSRNSQYKLTASIGVSCYPKDGESLEILHERVDQALYRAKNKGKNRVEVYR